MKKHILVPVVALCVSSLMAFTVYKRVIIPAISIIEIKPKPIHIFEPMLLPKVEVTKMISYSQNEFLDAIGQRDAQLLIDFNNEIQMYIIISSSNYEKTLHRPCSYRYFS